MADVGPSRDADLIAVVLTVDDKSPLAPQILQHLCDGLQEILSVKPQNLGIGTCRIGQRAEKVEDRPDADFLSWDQCMLRGRMKERGKEEGQAEFLRGKPAPFPGRD